MSPPPENETTHTGPPVEEEVRGALARLEREFRDLALLALADLAGLGLAAPELHHAVAGLQRPSWGHWNGLLVSLRGVRKEILRRASPAERRRFEGAHTLVGILEALGDRPPASLVTSLRPLARLAHFSLAARPSLGDLLAVPIALRNRVVHDRPTGPEWWEQAAKSLRVLLQYLDQEQPFRAVFTGAAWPSPWFVERDGQRLAFHGLTRDFTAVYVDRRGRSHSLAENGPEILRSLQGLLGRTRVQEQDFRRLLAELAPEEIRGVLLGDFLVGPPVGHGGHATVHRGRQLSTGRRVAIKLLRGDMPDQVRQRFQQEASWAALFGQHPHIVQVLACGEDPWRRPRKVDLSGEAWFRDFAKGPAVLTWMAMEWVDGPDLEAVIRSRRAARPHIRQLAEWFADAAGALATVHGSGLIHRDVKPGNMMVTRDGVLKVMDFGIARSQEEDRELRTVTGQEPGTPAYMSPEQLRADDPDAEVGPSSDIYSLCGTFYELFTGHRLFDHDSASPAEVRRRKLSGESPPRPRSLVPDLPWEIDAILMGGLEPEPADRYASMVALEQDLRRFLADEPITYRRPTAWRRLQLAWRRNRALYRAASVFVAILALVTWRYLHDVSEQRDHALAQTERLLLLSDGENLVRLASDARELGPARPENIAAMSDWLERARRLEERIPVHADVLRELLAGATTSPSGDVEFADARDGWWYRTEQKLLSDVMALTDPAVGLAARIRERLDFAERVAELSVEGAAAQALWAEARASIADRRECPWYRALDLQPQLGLLPIGRDPDSGLWEFAHLQSGEPAVRGEDGKLEIKPETGIVLVLLPGGEFQMGASPKPGSRNHDENALPREGPVQDVVLDPFFISKFELTRAQWLRLAGQDPRYRLRPPPDPRFPLEPMHPVAGVSWTQAAGLLAELDLVLPTEAQWEYAARAGTHWPWYHGPTKEGLDAVSNVADRSTLQFPDSKSWLGIDPELDDGFALMSPVGNLQANRFGLHDMLGNVWEWCLDPFASYDAPVNRGDGARRGGVPGNRMRRGGSFRNGPMQVRCSARAWPVLDGGGLSDGVRPARRVEGAGDS